MTPPLRPLESPSPEAAAPPPAPAAAPRRTRRRRAVAGGAMLLLAALAALGIHLFLTRGDETTDDAQVEADVVTLAPRVAGAVARVLVKDDQLVRRGDVLLELDDAELAARARQAEAEAETARAQAVAAGAQEDGARAALRKAAAESRRAGQDLERARRLRQGDAIPPERLDAAQAAADSGAAAEAAAEAQVAAARASAELARARVKGAEAALDLARLQLSYARVLSPVDGEVSRLSARAGQMLQAGQPVAELVPRATYVVANFKETQVGDIRPGQEADVEIDAFPGTTLHGRVESLSGGTGARFALLPPDNASGNFVKVVERVPVRIAWAGPPSAVDLRAGLSAVVTVHARR